MTATGPTDSQVPADWLDPGTPAEVKISTRAREPVTDPTLGIPLRVDGSTQRHRLVAIGDSLTHGFQSLAIFNTDLSYPALIARELGSYDNFVHPQYPSFGGLPLNLEFVLAELEQKYGDRIEWWAAFSAAFFTRHLVNQIELHWQGPGALTAPAAAVSNNLAIYGWDLRDVLSKSAGTERQALTEVEQGGVTTIGLNPFGVGSELKRYMDLCRHVAAIRVLDSARGPDGQYLTPLGAAEALGDDGGIETLVVFIGANNALGTVLDLGPPRWSGDDYADPVLKDQYNVWRPSHFLSEYRLLTDRLANVKAAHVIVCTIPHVTIAPIAKGVGATKMHPGSRYFEYYTRPWISDADFDPDVDAHLTGNQARAIDSAIDMYNDGIVDLVRQARQAGRDWLVMDTAGLLDRLAFRRYLQDPAARPDWWDRVPDPMPPALAALTPLPDTRFFGSGPAGRTQGGLIALDGVHPTTVCYGILAQAVIRVMEKSGVVFRTGQQTPRSSPIDLDFSWLLTRDSLLLDPPRSLTPDLRGLGWLNEIVDIVKRLSWH